jgi:hypothetical protein
VGRARLLGSTDTRFLLAGAAAFLALVAYVAVAYINTHASAATTQALAKRLASEIAPFVPHGSKLVPVRSGTGGGFAVRVTPLTVGNYGALAQTLVYRPAAGRRFTLSLRLRGSRAGQITRRSRPGRIAIFVDEPGLGGLASRYVVQTTVPATARWHRFDFSRRVEGRRLAIGLYVTRNTYRMADVSRSWFEIRDLTVHFH